MHITYHIYIVDTLFRITLQTYVYFKIPFSLSVHIITLLSADPEANLFPAIQNVKINEYRNIKVVILKRMIKIGIPSLQ